MKVSAGVLMFCVGRERFAIGYTSILWVGGFRRAIREEVAHEFVRGVVFLQKETIPVVDLKAAAGRGLAEVTAHTRIVVAELRLKGVMVKMGLLVDSLPWPNSGQRCRVGRMRARHPGERHRVPGFRICDRESARQPCRQPKEGELAGADCRVVMGPALDASTTGQRKLRKSPWAKH